MPPTAAAPIPGVLPPGMPMPAPSFLGPKDAALDKGAAAPLGAVAGSGAGHEAPLPLPRAEPPHLPEDTARALEDLRQRLNADLASKSELGATFEVMHGGYPDTTLLRFLRARECDPVRAHKMLLDCLEWRVKNDVDNILARPILGEKYEKIRASQQYGMTGFDKQGRPVLCVRVGLSYMDPDCKLEEYVHSHIQHNEYRDRVLLPEASRRKGAPVNSSVKIYDMSGLKLTHLGRMQMHRAVAAVDDLNYPEKSEVYYVVNAPSVFGACWKAVKPMLQERTRKKILVLSGNGAEELREDMDESALPHFVKYAASEGLGSSKNLLALATHPALQNPALDCCSHKHPYHVAMQQYMLGLRERAKATGMPRNTSQREFSLELGSTSGSVRKGEESDFASVLEETLSKVAISEGQSDS